MRLASRINIEKKRKPSGLGGELTDQILQFVDRTLQIIEPLVILPLLPVRRVELR